MRGCSATCCIPASRFRSNARRERRTGRRFTVSAFTVTFSRFTPSPKPGADGALTISEPSVEAAAALAARPRRIGIVTDDIQSAAALAAGYKPSGRS